MANNEKMKCHRCAGELDIYSIDDDSINKTVVAVCASCEVRVETHLNWAYFKGDKAAFDLAVQKAGERKWLTIFGEVMIQEDSMGD